MLYSCPTPACVEVVRERARMLEAEKSTPNRAPDLSSALADQAIDLALAAHRDDRTPAVREELIKAAALLIQAVERFDLETQVTQPVEA